MGYRKGIQYSRGALLFEVLRFVEPSLPHRPAFLLLENVPGLLLQKDGNVFASVVASLRKRNYDVVGRFVWNAPKAPPRGFGRYKSHPDRNPRGSFAGIGAISNHAYVIESRGRSGVGQVGPYDSNGWSHIGPS